MWQTRLLNPAYRGRVGGQLSLLEPLLRAGESHLVEEFERAATYHS